jgi:hypothetical protein
MLSMETVCWQADSFLRPYPTAISQPLLLPCFAVRCETQDFLGGTSNWNLSARRNNLYLMRPDNSPTGGFQEIECFTEGGLLGYLFQVYTPRKT